MAPEGSFPSVSWDLGRARDPCSSIILRYQVGISSEQPLLCYATLSARPRLPTPVPSRSFGKRKKEKKKNLTGFQRSSRLFSQVSCYLNAGLSVDWASRVQLVKLTAPLSSPAMGTLRALRPAALSLAQRRAELLRRLVPGGRDCSVPDHAAAGPGSAVPLLSAPVPHCRKHHIGG